MHRCPGTRVDGYFGAQGWGAPLGRSGMPDAAGLVRPGLSWSPSEEGDGTERDVQCVCSQGLRGSGRAPIRSLGRACQGLGASDPEEDPCSALGCPETQPLPGARHKL